MAVARIVRAAAARRDIVEIWSYIATESSPTVADAMVARISWALQLLAEAPMMGKRQSELDGKPRGFPVRPYKIFYEPLPERDGILVWRILHGARDLRRIVHRPSKEER